MADYQVAHSNVARMRAPLEEAVMAGFVARLDPLNALADASEGFIWRYETPEGDTTEAEIFGDPLILFNLSVWESVEALERYAYRGDHLQAVQMRTEWFERPHKSPVVLWWVPAGHRPSVQEAKDRFDRLWESGPTADAFTFRNRYPSPGSTPG